MTDMMLTVINSLSPGTFRPALASSDFPEGVSGRVVWYTGQSLVPPEGEGMLLLTNDLVLAQSCLNPAQERLFVVYVGDGALLGDDFEACEEVWNGDEDGALLKRRYLRLLRRLRERFDGKLYRMALETTMETVPDMLWFKDLDGLRLMVNEALVRRAEKPREEIIGRSDFDIWGMQDTGSAPDCYLSDTEAIRAGGLITRDEAIYTTAGKKLFTIYKAPLTDPFGNVYGTVGMGHDVSGFTNLGNELSMLVEHMPFAMSIFTPDWQVVRMNNPFIGLTGVEDPGTFDYHSWVRENLDPASPQRVSAKHNAVIQEYVTRAEREEDAKNYTVIQVEIRDNFDNLAGYYVTINDETLQKSFERQIMHTAETDGLTGLRNRRSFYEKLERLTGDPLWLAYMDLDRFKRVNDCHGHEAGDQVLVRTAELIRELFPDALASRIGGDEFAVAVAGWEQAEMLRRCEALEKAVCEAFKEYGTTVSIGVSGSGEDRDLDRMIRESDRQMYMEKHAHHQRREEPAEE